MPFRSQNDIDLPRSSDDESDSNPPFTHLDEDSNASMMKKRRSSFSSFAPAAGGNYGSLEPSLFDAQAREAERNKYSTMGSLNRKNKRFSNLMSLYKDSLTLLAQDEDSWETVEIDGRTTRQRIPKGDDEKEPLIDGDEPEPSVPMNNNAKTFFTLIKSFIGSGILFLPKGFDNGGLIFSTVLLVVFAFISLFGMLRLVATKRAHGTGSFQDLGDKSMSLLVGPKTGKTFKFIVEIFLAASQLGFCAAGCSFVANTVETVLKDWLNKHLSFGFLVFIQLIFFLPISLTRQIQKLGPLAIFADIIILFGFVVLTVFNIKELAENGVKQTIAFNSSKFTLFFGTIVYAYEGIGLIIPIEEAMQRPQDFPKVLTATVAVVAGAMAIVAIPSYLAYGSNIDVLVFHSLPRIPLVFVTEILYASALFFTFPLILFPGTKIIEMWILSDKSGRQDKKVKWSKNIIRMMCVLLACTTAWGFGESLEIFVALIGALCCGPLMFIFPAMFHFAVNKSIFQRILDVLLFIFGCAVTFYVTYQTIADIVVKSLNS